VIEIFADTAYWVGLLLLDDQLHDKAVNAARDIPDGSKIITSDLVLIEFLNYVSRHEAIVRKAACEMWSNLEAGPLR
jgi:predicted nucleic acid-binding protein